MNIRKVAKENLANSIDVRNTMLIIYISKYKFLFAKSVCYVIKEKKTLFQ